MKPAAEEEHTEVEEPPRTSLKRFRVAPHSRAGSPASSEACPLVSGPENSPDRIDQGGVWELAHAAAIGPTHCQGRQQGHRREFGPCHVTPYLRIGHLGAGRTARTAPWLAEAPGLRRYLSTGWVHPDTVAWIASPIMATSFTAVGQGSRAPRLGSTGAGAPTQREGGSRGSRLSAEWAFLSAAEGTVSPGCMRARWSGERHQQARHVTRH